MPRISVPTTARLPSSLRVDSSNPAVTKILTRLSRNSLVSVALDWLYDNNVTLAPPYLRRADESEDEDDENLNDFNPPARSLRALQELYADLQTRKGSKREVLDRIIEGDWRHGLTLYQLAMADLQYLYDHPTSQKWTAFRIVALKTSTSDDADDDDNPQQEIDKESLIFPRFHPSTFLKSLQETVLPDVKAHYNFDRHKTLPLLLLRIFITDSPYNTSLSMQHATAAFDVSRTVYIAFPDASPYIYISKPQTLTSSAGGGGSASESNSLRKLLLEGIPKALSRPPYQRFTLKSTNLTTKNLHELLDKRGPARTNSAGGGWSIYADESFSESPFSLALRPALLTSGEEEEEEDTRDLDPWERERREKERARMARATSPASARDEEGLRRARLVARGRFGGSARVGDGKGVERVDIVVEDAFPGGEGSGGLSRKRKRRDEEEEGGEGEPAAVDAAKGRKSGVELALERSRLDEDSDEEGEDEEGEDQDENVGETSNQQPQKQKSRVNKEDEWRPNIRLTFHGTHVFAGIRQLVEKGIIDGERMPGWMTGEEGVTIGAVRNGRIRGHKGAGL